MAVGAISGLSTAVESAVRSAASATGVDFDFLMKTARRESGYNPLAQAGTSSAAGLFQFVEQTWLGVMKRHGAAHGYARYAQLIQESGDGRFAVPGENARRAVMDLRYDPQASAVMAGELAADHAAYLRGRTGREPTGGELYAAHFLGPQGSARLIDANLATPDAAAASLFPDAAAANHNVFYRNGAALSVSQVYGELSRSIGGSAAAAAAPAQADQGQAAFSAYADAGRTERERERGMLIDFLLKTDDQGRGPAGSMFTSELLTILSDAGARR